MRRVSFAKAILLSLPVVIATTVFATSAPAAKQPICHTRAVAQKAVSGGQCTDNTDKKALLCAVKQPMERLAVLASSVNISEGPTTVPSNESVKATFHWSLLAIAFLASAWWFQRLVTSVLHLGPP